MKRKPTAAVVRSDGYLVFQVEDGQLETMGLYETYTAAKERMAAMGLADTWKIATITCWFSEKVARGSR
jgi:hypothetical protein